MISGRAYEISLSVGPLGPEQGIMADSRKRSRATEAEEFEPTKKRKASKDVVRTL